MSAGVAQYADYNCAVSNESPGYDTKPPDGEVQVLSFFLGMWIGLYCH